MNDLAKLFCLKNKSPSGKFAERLFFSLCMSILSLALTALGTTAGAEYQPIHKAELISAMHSGTTINGRNIDAEVLRAAMYDIKSVAETLAGRDIVKVNIRESVVNGTLDLSSGVCPTPICERADVSLVMNFNTVVFNPGKNGLSLTTSRSRDLGEVGTVYLALTMTLSTVNGNVRFDNVELANGTSIKRNRFAGDVEIARATLCGSCATTKGNNIKPDLDFYIQLSHNVFEQDFYLINSEIHRSTDMSNNVFNGNAILSGLSVRARLKLNECSFRGIARFNMINTSTMPYGWGAGRSLFYIPDGSSLEFRSAMFSEMPIFKKIQIDNLIFDSLPVARITNPYLYESRQNLIIGKPTNLASGLTITQSACNTCSFSSATIFGVTDLRYLTVGSNLGLDSAVFNGAIYLQGLRAPKITISDSLFNSKIFADWESILPAMVSHCRSNCTDQFQMLIDNFKQFDNAAALNEVQYAMAAKNPSSSILMWVIWGWGHRPAHCLYLLMLLFFAYSIVYSTQIAEYRPSPSLSSLSAQACAAMRFSFACSTKFSYAWKNTTNWKFRLIACSQSIAMKLLFILFLISLAKSSPLISEIIGKIL